VLARSRARIPPQHKQVQERVAPRPPPVGGMGASPPPRKEATAAVPAGWKEPHRPRGAPPCVPAALPPATSGPLTGAACAPSRICQQRRRRPARAQRRQLAPARQSVVPGDVAPAPPRLDGAATQIVPVTERTGAKYKSRTSGVAR